MSRLHIVSCFWFLQARGCYCRHCNDLRLWVKRLELAEAKGGGDG